MNADPASLVARIQSAHANGTPLRIRGGGSKDFYGGAPQGDLLAVMLATAEGRLALLGDIAFSDDTAMTVVLAAAGYPKAADPAAIHYGTVIAILTLLVLYVTMVYGPIAALLVELFPTRIRYTSMSLPYHIGNGWFGGMLPLRPP